MKFVIDTDEISSLRAAIKEDLATPSTIGKWAGYETRNSGDLVVLPGWYAQADGETLLSGYSFGHPDGAEEAAKLYALRVEFGRYAANAVDKTVTIKVWRECIDRDGGILRVQEEEFEIEIKRFKAR